MRAVLVALVVCAVPPPLGADPEPKYEGKPLDYWVQRFQKAETAEQRKDAAEALRTFGPKAAPAVPALVEMLSDLSEGFRNQVIEILAAIGPMAEDARPVILKLAKEYKVSRHPSLAAVIAISSEPKDAVRVLAPYLESPEMGGDVLFMLCEIGPDAKEALPAIRRHVLKQLADCEEGKEKCLYALDRLHQLGPEVVPLLVEMLDAHGGRGRNDALACLLKLGPGATKATPALLPLLKPDDPFVRLRVAYILWKIEKHPASVTVLAESLKDFRTISLTTRDPPYTLGVASTAAQCLGDFGPEAKAALPQLREAVAVGYTLWVLTSDCEPPDCPLCYLCVPFTRKLSVAKGGNAVELWSRAQERIRVGWLAREATDKIEGKPKK